MEIIVEDARVELDIPKDGVSLGQVVDEVEHYLLTVGRVPVALEIDGHTLTQEELEQRLEEAVRGDEKIEFGVVQVVEFVADNLEGVGPANQELLKNLQQFADQIQRGEPSDHGEGIVQELTHFFDFWLKMRALLPDYFSKVQVDGKEYSKLFDDMRGVLQEVLTALEDNDPVLAADLLQYEAIPLIEKVDRGMEPLKQAIKDGEKEALPT